MARLPHKDFYYSNSIYKDMSAGPYEGFENYKSGVYQKYEEFDSQPEDVFTVFYTPRCPACTNIRPVVQQTLGGIATEYVDYKLGNYNRLGNKAVVMVNVDRYPEVVQRFNLQSFPTLKLLRGVTDRVTLDSTAVVDYTGGRTVTEIDSFIQGGGVNVNEYFNSQPEDVFTMFYSPRSPIISRIRPVIQQTLGGIATEYVDYRVGNYNRYGDKAVVMVDVDRYPGMVRKFNLQQFPTFKLLRGVTDRVNLNATTVVDYSGPPTVTEIDSFIQGNSINVNEYFNSQPEDVFTMFYSPRSPIISRIRPVIQQTLGGIATEYVDYRVGNYNRYGDKAVLMVDVDRYPGMVRKFNLQQFPTFKLLRGVTDRVNLNATAVVDYSGPPAVTEIDSFIQGNGVSVNVNVNEYFDSQPENVFTLFYTPRCGYCKDVMPVIQQSLGGIATEYVDYRVGNYRRYDNNAVVMVNVDEYPEMTQRFKLQGFPTFKLLRGVTDRNTLDATTVVDYNGGRTVQEIDTFIRG